jgi:DNA-binding MarR family transcriptional regulator
MQSMTNADIEALLEYFHETIVLSHRLSRLAEEVHANLDLSAGKRGVLMGLDRTGPQTVPQMARARPVSRQHIQSLVNPLREAGYVELIDNPAHKRSKLVRLTAAGEAMVASMRAREAELLGAFEVNIDVEELKTSAATMRHVRQAFEGTQWKRILQKHSPEVGES